MNCNFNVKNELYKIVNPVQFFLSLSLSLSAVLIVFVCGIVMFICVCSIAWTGC